MPYANSHKSFYSSLGIFVGTRTDNSEITRGAIVSAGPNSPALNKSCLLQILQKIRVILGPQTRF